ncbi:MAG: GAF domain-containing protein [Anaerolineae bacterium]|jgi:GAF domain-containing protein/HAMP domain-containing protein|nr:GAF domain-containing protein [Anaerolineae bacterium]
MRTLLNINHWSIQSKLLFFLALLTLIPVLLVLITLQRSAETRDQNITERYVQQVGEERLARLTFSLRQSTELLNSLTENLRYRRTLINLFEGRNDRSTRQEIISLFFDRLVEPNFYRDVRFLNADGVVMGNTITTRSTNRLDGRDFSDSPSYLAGQSARLLNESQRIVIYTENDQIIIDIVQVVYYGDRRLAGYIIATLNNDQILINNLISLSTFAPVYSYLTTADNLIIAPEEFMDLAEESRRHPFIQQGLTGQTRVTTAAIADDQFTTHYATIPNTRLILITETLEEITFSPPFQEFISEGGLLISLILVGLVVIFAAFLGTLLANPLNEMRLALQEVARGNFETPLASRSRTDEIGLLAQTLVSVREQIRETIAGLQENVAARVRDVQATQEVSRAASTERDLQKLMDNVVNLIVQQFPNIYHAQIFLNDSEGIYAVLRASTGEAGRQLLARGHRLAIGSTSVIGQVTGDGRLTLVRDITSSEVHKRNEFLMETRSELAIPLRVGERIIGALDVQSKQDNSFSDDQVKLLQVMADQIAISLDNARLYEESIRRLEEITATGREKTFAAWQEYLYANRAKQLTANAGLPIDQTRTELYDRAIWEGKTQIGKITPQNTIPFAVPIQLRGQTLGAVEWEIRSTDYTYEKVQLAEELVSRLAISLDNARLFQQSQRSTERERIVNYIASQLTGQTDIDDILQTAVREVGQALRLPEVNIRLNLTHNTSKTNGHYSDDLE